VASYDTTGKYGMRALQGGSLVNEIDDGFAALRNDVRDNMAGYASGTFGSRPAAGVSGRLYLATDTGELYLDTGFVWLRVSGPTPWETVLDGGIIWPASAGAASLWFSGSRGNGAAGYLAVPPLWAYRSADTPTGMAVEYRFVGAAMQNTTPNQTFTVGVAEVDLATATTAAQIPVDLPPVSATVGWAAKLTLTANTSGGAGAIGPTSVIPTITDGHLYTMAMYMGSAPAANSYLAIGLQLQRRFKLI
jgi:hypothetical protein